VLYDEPPHITASEVAARRAEGWTLLDVRTDAEWEAGRIPGSVHLPMDQLVARLAEVPADVICVCAVGARSERVAQYLLAAGRSAVNLEGGVHAWAAEGRPLEA